MTTARTERPAPDHVPGRALLEGRTNVMVFPASDHSSYLTGEVVPVSGRHP
ncbi:hypothetical protein [Actinomadura sp. CNU-125]|uniref:hypothetical protein n=1 Tax=Actinomadura sp. CNU-125 TaxID=1904961 RepID=UPI001301388E|nr:hypothetical protein [Actinomadura sp. CNU-125]